MVAKPGVGVMVALSFSTGMLDAATFLGLHGVFTANMTGNLIFVSLGLAGQAAVPWQRALVAIAGFVVGAALLGRLSRRLQDRVGDAACAVLGVALVACVLAAVAGGLATATPGALLLDASTFALAFAMGAQAMVARRVGVPDVSTVVVTSTLAALVGENSVTGGSASSGATRRRAVAVGSMALGAVTGSFLMFLSVTVAIAASSGLTVGVAAVMALSLFRGRRLEDDASTAPGALPRSSRRAYRP